MKYKNKEKNLRLFNFSKSANVNSPSFEVYKNENPNVTVVNKKQAFGVEGSIYDQIGLLISDIEMPEMDGYTLTAKLRNEPELNKLKIILHTSLSGVFNQAMVKKVGADNFIAKFNPDDLAKAVKELMQV